MLPETPFPPIDYAALLNADQLGAVVSRAPHTLVLAGAGSGKTRTLTFRVAHLLEEGVPAQRILLLTFTNKAADEMLSRVEDLTRIPRKNFWGGTFHAFGLRILRGNAEAAGLQPNFSVLDADDADALFATVAKRTAPAFFKDRFAPRPRVIFDIISFARNTMIPLAEIVREHRFRTPDAEQIFGQFFEEYTKEKREQNAVDYDDLLELVCTLLRGNADVRERFSRRFLHILVDEFQDTNALQAEIIRLLVGPQTHVTAVGDDAQCIYTWRGANYENIVGFPERFAGTQVCKVEINYRSTPQILDFSNSVLRSRTEASGFTKTLRAVCDDGEKPLVIGCADAFAQARGVVSVLRSLVEREGLSPGDIAILYRAHYQAKELQLELSRRGIPFVITSGVQFFQQAHIRDFTAQLRFLQNPSDLVAFTRLLCLMEKVGTKTAERVLVSARALAAKEQIPLLAALLFPSILKKIPEPAQDDFRDLVLTLQNMDELLRTRKCCEKVSETSPAGTPKFVFDELFSDAFAGADSPPPGAPAEPQFVADPAEIIRIGIDGWYGDFLKKIYADADRRREDLESLVGFAARFRSLEDLLAQLALLNSETTSRDVRADGGRAPLRLSTIHQAKGLEFPVVIVIGCSDGLFPLNRAITAGEIEEERRLFYVACTRARKFLFLFHQKMSGTRMPELLEVSRFIREADPATFRRTAFFT